MYLLLYNSDICISCIFRHVLEVVDREWSDIDLDNDSYITWEEYKNRTFGELSMIVYNTDMHVSEPV